MRTWAVYLRCDSHYAGAKWLTLVLLIQTHTHTHATHSANYTFFLLVPLYRYGMGASVFTENFNSLLQLLQTSFASQVRALA